MPLPPLATLRRSLLLLAVLPRGWPKPLPVPCKGCWLKLLLLWLCIRLLPWLRGKMPGLAGALGVGASESGGVCWLSAIAPRRAWSARCAGDVRNGVAWALVAAHADEGDASHKSMRPRHGV